MLTRTSKFKSISILSLALTLAFSMTACGTGGKAGTNEGTSQGGGATASNYPTKEVHMIGPFGAGATLDLAARALTKGFQDATGQPLVVDNEPGGSGVPGTEKLAQAKPDGYTLAILPSGQLSLRPALEQVKYSFPKDFTPILGMADFEMVYVAGKSAPYKTMKEAVDYYETKNDQPKIATSGVNTYGHLLTVMISQQTGMQFRHLPFDGNNNAVTAVLGGNADIAVVNLSNVTSQLKSGDLKVLAVPSKDRYPNLKDASTLSEQGINVVGGATFAIYGPANMPQDLVNKLREIFLKAMDSEQFKQFATNSNLLLTKTTPQQITDEITKDSENIKKIVSELSKSQGK